MVWNKLLKCEPWSLLMIHFTHLKIVDQKLLNQAIHQGPRGVLHILTWCAKLQDLSIGNMLVPQAIQ